MERLQPFRILADDVIDIDPTEVRGIIHELEGTKDERLLALSGILSLYTETGGQEEITLYGSRSDLGHYYLWLAFTQVEEGDLSAGIQSFNYSRQLEITERVIPL